MRLNEIPRGESVTGLFYGGAGTGKTHICASADSDRVIYCNVEDRLSTIQSPKVKALFPKFNPIVITVNEGHLPDSGAKALDQLTREINKNFEEKGSEFDIVIVDGATALRRFALNKALELAQKGPKGGQTLGKLKALSTEVPFVDLLPGDIGNEIRMIESFIIEMKDTCARYKKHFFMTAHERIEYNPAPMGQEKTVRSCKPGFSGQTFPDSIPGLFDFVWKTVTIGAENQTTYWAYTSGSSTDIAKTTGFSVPSVKVQNPSIPKIIRAFKEGVEYGK